MKAFVSQAKQQIARWWHKHFILNCCQFDALFWWLCFTAKTDALPVWINAKGFTPHQFSKDNRPIFLLLFLMLLHVKDIWRNICGYQRGCFLVICEGATHKSIFQAERPVEVFQIAQSPQNIQLKISLIFLIRRNCHTVVLLHGINVLSMTRLNKNRQDTFFTAVKIRPR